jgi:hypothetical protein
MKIKQLHKTGHYGDESWIILSHNNLSRFEASDVFQSVLERMKPFIGARIQIDDSKNILK